MGLMCSLTFLFVAFIVILVLVGFYAFVFVCFSFVFATMTYHISAGD